MNYHSSETIYLVKAPGIWIPKENVKAPEKATYENSIIVNDLLSPKKIAEDQDIYAANPCMPAIPPKFDINDQKEEVNAPIKGKSSPYSDVVSKGYRSGRRSALIPCRIVKIDDNTKNEWFIAKDSHNNGYVPDFDKFDVYLRVKGCGMWIQDEDIPFPGITNKDESSIHASEQQKIVEIRGVCFLNTSPTEIYVNQQIENILNKMNLRSGNRSLGFWIYKNLKNDASPLIEKTVSIFETLGDRRLETHLLAGLEELIPQLFSEDLATKVTKIAIQLYGSTEKIPSINNTTCRRQSKVHVSSIKTILPTLFGSINDYLIDDFSDEKLIDIGFLPTQKIYSALQKENIPEEILNFFKLFGRLGFEAGRCLSAVHRSGFLWGSFADHNEQFWHCNAHADNLIVLSKEDALKSGKLQILAPVDFDMSFNQESTVDIWTDPKHAIPDDSRFLNGMSSEVSNMMSDMAGLAATYPNISTAIHSRNPPPPIYDTILWLCRDCSTYESYYGYQHLNSDGYPGNDISIDAIYQLIDKGLNQTYHVQS